LLVAQVRCGDDLDADPSRCAGPAFFVRSAMRTQARVDGMSL